MRRTLTSPTDKTGQRTITMLEVEMADILVELKRCRMTGIAHDTLATTPPRGAALRRLKDEGLITHTPSPAPFTSNGWYNLARSGETAANLILNARRGAK